MNDNVQGTDKISTNRIVGELITKEKYKFIDGKLISEIVRDVIDTVNERR